MAEIFDVANHLMWQCKNVDLSIHAQPHFWQPKLGPIDPPKLFP